MSNLRDRAEEFDAYESKPWRPLLQAAGERYTAALDWL
jgi:hypothetical protein